MWSLVTVGSRFISFLDDRRSGCLTSVLTAHCMRNKGNHFFSLKFESTLAKSKIHLLLSMNLKLKISLLKKTAVDSCCFVSNPNSFVSDAQSSDVD